MPNSANGRPAIIGVINVQSVSANSANARTTSVLRLSPREAKAQITEVTADVNAAIRRAAIPATSEKPTAPENAVRTGTGTRRVGYTTSRVVPVPISAPLPHVAVHVVEVPGIGFHLTHRMRRME